MNPIVQLLYAEDNPLDADLTRARLAEHAPEFELRIVTTGAECLEQIRQRPPDLVLLDNHLPDTDGVEILKTLFAQSPGLPVVMVTGAGDEELVVRALRLGAANYVPKQGNYLETLPGVLRDVLAERRRKPDEASPALPSRRILYVEHLAMDIEITVRHLGETAPHFNVEVVHSCAEALERLARPQAYDLVLIDLRMPDQSGLDFLREAKTRRLPLPPVIIVTGGGDDATAIAALKLGAADYIPKREGYLDQLSLCMERSIAHDQLSRLNTQLRVELAERQRTEAALRESEEKFAKAFLESPVSMAIRELEQGRYLDVNNACLAMMGYAREEVIGHTPLEIGWMEEADRAANLPAFTATAAMRDRELRLRRRDGSFVLCLYNTHIVQIGGRPCVLSMSLDITEHKRSEEERQALHAQLIQARKMEAVGQLAGGVAHDFNNILTAIILQLNILQDDPNLFAETRSGLKDLEGEAKRAVQLTRQLLMFSRRQDLQPQVLDLNALLGNLLKMLRRLIGENIDLEFNGALGNLWLDADPGMLEQVTMNLVVNARDAMPGGGRITLMTRLVNLDASASKRNVEAYPGQFVCLAVSDTGCGMDDATRGRIFEPFFTTKEVGKGTGLGLATVYGIVKQHRGWVEVETAVGRGSTFSLYLPAREQVATMVDQVFEVGSVPGGHENLLVVEDEDSVRRGLLDILGKLGYRVWAAGNGPDALQQWAQREGQIDLVITDVVMPGGISGIELADRLRQQKQALKVILLSGYSPDNVTLGITQTRGVYFLQKPFEAALLARTVRTCLDASEATSSRIDAVGP